MQDSNLLVEVKFNWTQPCVMANEAVEVSSQTENIVDAIIKLGRLHKDEIHIGFDKGQRSVEGDRGHTVKITLNARSQECKLEVLYIGYVEQLY